MGVWIETPEVHQNLLNLPVTPFVGVWIETSLQHLFRELLAVTPFVGVWIETALQGVDDETKLRHTLRGCVD